MSKNSAVVSLASPGTAVSAGQNHSKVTAPPPINLKQTTSVPDPNDPNSAIHGFTPSGKPRLFQCTICLRSFARLEHLKRHEKSHTKEKPFHCGICEKKFSRRDLLLRHAEKLHAGRPDAVKRLRRRRRKRDILEVTTEDQKEKSQPNFPSQLTSRNDLSEKYQLPSSSIKLPTLALFRNDILINNITKNYNNYTESSENIKNNPALNHRNTQSNADIDNDSHDSTVTSPSTNSSSIKVNSLFKNFVSKPNFKRHQQKRPRRSSFSASSGGNYALPTMNSLQPIECSPSDNNSSSSNINATSYYNSTNDLNFDFSNAPEGPSLINNNNSDNKINTFTNIRTAEFSTPQFPPYIKSSYSFSAASSSNRSKNGFQLEPEFDIPVFSLNNNSKYNTNNHKNFENSSLDKNESSTSTNTTGNLADKFKNVVFADYDIYGTDNFDTFNNSEFSKKKSNNLSSSSGVNNWMMNDILDSSQLEFLTNLQSKYDTRAISKNEKKNHSEEGSLGTNPNYSVNNDRYTKNNNGNSINNDEHNNNDLFYGYGFYMDDSSISPITNSNNYGSTNNNHYVTLAGSNMHHRDSLNESNVSSLTMEKSNSGNNSGSSGVLDTISELNNFQNFQFLTSLDRKLINVSQKGNNNISSHGLPYISGDNEAGSSYTKSTNSTETMLTSSSNNSNNSNDNPYYHNDIQPINTTVTTAATTKNNSNNSAENKNNCENKYFSHFNNISNGYGYYDNIINSNNTPQDNSSNNSTNNYCSPVMPDPWKLFDSKMRRNVDLTLARYPFIGIEQPFVGTINELNTYIDSYYKYFNLVPHTFYPSLYEFEFSEQDSKELNDKIIIPLREAASVCLPLLMATMGAVSLCRNSKSSKNIDKNMGNTSTIGGENIASNIASNLYEASRRCIHVYLDLHKQWRTKCLKPGSKKSKKTSQNNKTPLWLLQALTLSVTYAIFGEFGHAQQIALKQATALISLLKNMDFEDSFADFTTMQYLNLANASSPSGASSHNIETLKDLGHVNNSFLESCWESFEKLDILGNGNRKILNKKENSGTEASSDPGSSGNIDNSGEVFKLRQKYLMGQSTLRTVYQICNLSFFLEYFYGIERKTPPISKTSKLPFPDFDDDFNKIANYENCFQVPADNDPNRANNTNRNSMYLNIFEISLLYMPGIMEVFRNLINMNTSFFSEHSSDWKISELGLLTLQNMFLSYILNMDNFLNTENNHFDPEKPNNDTLNNQNSLLWFGQCKLFNPTLRVLLSQKQSNGSGNSEFGKGLKNCVLLQDYTYLRLSMFPSMKYQTLRNEFFWDGNLKKIFKSFFSNEDIKFQDEMSSILYSLKLLTQVFFPEFHKSIFLDSNNVSMSNRKQIMHVSEFMKRENENLFRMLNMLYQWNQSSGDNIAVFPYLEFNPPERFSLYHQVLFDALLVLSGFCYRFESGNSKNDALYVKAYHLIKILTRVIENSYQTTLFPDISSYVTNTAYMVSTSSSLGYSKSASIIDQHFCSLKFSYYSIGLCLIVLDRCGFDVFNKVGVRTMRFMNSEMVNYVLAISNSNRLD